MSKKSLLLVLAAVFLLPVLPLQADKNSDPVSRIAVLNLEKVFNLYYKSRIAEDQINQQAEAYRSYLARLDAQLRQLTTEAENARQQALNTALAADERQKAEQLALSAAKLVTGKKSEMEIYAARCTRELKELQQKKHQEVMDDIRREIARCCEVSGYSFVFDSSGKTTCDQPAVLFFPADHDITEEVLRELNRTRAQSTKQEEK